jgi:hypothetical protein
LNEENKKVCIFCDTDLSIKGNKAKEHILSAHLQRKLGVYDKLSTGKKLYANEGVLRDSPIPFRSLVGGQICNICNNGWMNDLDHSVERFLLQARDGSLKIHNLDHADRFLLTRYLLKTAVAFLTVDKPERRHISREFTTQIRNPGFIPSGLLSFVFLAPVRSLTVALDRLDYWPLVAEDQEFFGAFERLKFGLQINQYSFGIAFTAAPSPCLSFNPNYFDILIRSGIRWASISSDPHNAVAVSGYSGWNVSAALGNIGYCRPESIGLPESGIY